MLNKNSETATDAFQKSYRLNYTKWASALWFLKITIDLL